MLKQNHFYISGDVIGVGFRAWTKIQAKIIGVNGWVKNVHTQPDRYGPSGGVEAVIQGEAEAVDKITAIIKEGPPLAHIVSCDCRAEDVVSIYETFDIKK